MSATLAAHRRDIQGLRAAAVLLVLADHAFGFPAGGYIGVDVFFVISGYLITGLLVRHGPAGRPSLRAFYVRRARRILPAALLVLASTDLLARLLFAPLRARQTVSDSLWAAVFGANRHFAALGVDYFARSRPVSPVQHYWSLSVEEQFYLVWPVLILVAAAACHGRETAGRRAALGLAALGSVGSFLWSLHATAVAPVAAYFSTATRGWELGAGALLCLAPPSRHPRAAALGAWAGLAAIGAAALLFDGTTAMPGAAALLPVAGAALVLHAGDPACGPGRVGLLGNAVAHYLGDLSYSLYLWHLPCLVLAGAAFPHRGPAFWVAGAVAPFALAALSHHFVEEPFRRGRRRPRRAPVRRAAAAGALLVAFGCLVPTLALAVVPAVVPVPVPAPAPARMPVLDPAAAPTADPILLSLSAQQWPALVPPPDQLDRAGAPEWIQDACLNVLTGADVRRCTYGDPAGDKLLVVLGDSMAASYMPGLRAALPPRGWRISMLTFQECPYVLLPSFSHVSGAQKPYLECMAHRAFAIEQVRRLRPDVVVASSLSTLFVDRIVGVGADTRLAVWEAGTRSALAAVAGSTRRLVLLAGPPNGANLQDCYTPRSSPQDCVSAPPADWYPLAAVEQAAATAVGAHYVSPLPWLCAQDRCPSFIGRTPVRYDEGHLTAAFSRSLAGNLRRAVMGA